MIWCESPCKAFKPLLLTFKISFVWIVMLESFNLKRCTVWSMKGIILSLLDLCTKQTHRIKGMRSQFTFIQMAPKGNWCRKAFLKALFLMRTFITSIFRRQAIQKYAHWMLISFLNKFFFLSNLGLNTGIHVLLSCWLHWHLKKDEKRKSELKRVFVVCHFN